MSVSVSVYVSVSVSVSTPAFASTSVSVWGVGCGVWGVGVCLVNRLEDVAVGASSWMDVGGMSRRNMHTTTLHDAKQCVNVQAEHAQPTKT